MRATVILLLAAAFAGCVSLHKQAPIGGSFGVNVRPADDKTLVADAVARLVVLYPPAVTRFDLRHPAADPFGNTLLSALRQKGYALNEYQATAKANPKEDVRTLSYIFDQLADDLYRVTLIVDAQSLSRAYTVKDGALAAAGAWVRKE